MERYPKLADLRRASPGRRVTATSAAKNFGRLVDMVRETQAEYIVERDGHPVVTIAPAGLDQCRVADLVGLLRSMPAPGVAFRREVAAARAAGNRPSVPRAAWDS
jgi:hypothetical protein